MTSSDFYDVAVIGYGPTGATAANLLGKQGLKVLVIERDPDVYGRARAISTDEEVMRIWQSVGLADRLQRDMLPDRPLHFVGADGVPFIDLKIASRGCGHPPQQFLYQPAVDHVLRDGLAQYANVQVLLEHECLRVMTVGDHADLLLADLQSDTLKRVRASYVIAADGGSSPTRGQLGVGYVGRTCTERWVVIDTKVIKEWDAHDRLRFHCNPSRPTVDCPTPLGHHRWEYPARTDEDERVLLSDDEIWKVLGDQGITAEHVEILRAVIYSHHVRVADRWRVGRVFLAGDAAHAMPPWIGQGMSSGVRDAANLCWKLAAVLKGQARESLLDSYQAERQPHVIEVTRRACLVGRIITERNSLVAAVRNRVGRVVNRVPGLAARLEKRMWIPDARYRAGFLGGGSGAAVGWQVPQPWVSHHGDRVRLDDVIGGRWAVLYVGALPARADAWMETGAVAIAITEPTLVGWLRRRNATSVVVRPDGFVYAAADFGEPIPPPTGVLLSALPHVGVPA